jgi:hypothetical protein
MDGHGLTMDACGTDSLLTMDRPLGLNWLWTRKATTRGLTPGRACGIASQLSRVLTAFPR